MVPSPAQEPRRFFPSFRGVTLPMDSSSLLTELLLAVHVENHLRTFTVLDLYLPLPSQLLSEIKLTLGDVNPVLSLLELLSTSLNQGHRSAFMALEFYFLEKISSLHESLGIFSADELATNWPKAFLKAHTLLGNRLTASTVTLARWGPLDRQNPGILLSVVTPPPPTPPAFIPGEQDLTPSGNPEPAGSGTEGHDWVYSQESLTHGRDLELIFPMEPPIPLLSEAADSSSPDPEGGPQPTPHSSHTLMDNRMAAQTGKTIINLSQHVQLSPTQTGLLNKGLSFIPTEGIEEEGVWRTLGLETHHYHRRLKLAWHFGERGKDETDWENDPRRRFAPKSNWQPKMSSLPAPLRVLFRKDWHDLRRLQRAKYRAPNPNVTAKEMKELKALKDNKHLVFKPADKGSAVVLQDREDYVWEALRQLNMVEYYQKLDVPLGPATAARIKKVLHQLVIRGCITRGNKEVLQGKQPYQTRTIYFLPKIHKKPETWPLPGRIPAGRPIVSDCGSETYIVAEYLDTYLNPLSHRHASYVKDTNDFLDKVREAHVNPTDLIFSMDVDALYTNIETEPGLDAVRACFLRYPSPGRPDDLLLELLEISLNTNDFQFDGQHYLQIKGVAMGKKFAPALADIYMAEWEETALAQCELKPSYYYRYLDDIWGIWPHSKEEFVEFVTRLNNHHRSISLKYELDANSMDFLDTTTFKGPDFQSTKRLDTKVFFKPTDTHALLFGTSYHPRHTFRGVVKSQLLRFKRICSREEDFEEATGILFSVLRKRGYTRSFLRDTKRVFQQRRPDEEETKRFPLVAHFGPRAYRVNRCYKKNFRNILGNFEAAEHWKPIASYRKNPNLKNLLVRSKLPSLEAAPKPTNDKRFFTRPFVNGKEGDTRLLPPPYTTSMDTTNCVYLIRCRHCGKGYVGETMGSLRTRIAQHLHNIGTYRKTDTPLVTHFLDHGADHLKATVLEHDLFWSTAQRKRKEMVWIRFLGTQEPMGFNRRILSS